MLQSGDIDRSLLSHVIRNSQRKNPLRIFESDLPAYLNSGLLPTPREQADRLILWIGNNQWSPAEWASNATNEALAATIGSRISRDESAFNWLVSETKDKGWFSLHSNGINGCPAFLLTLEGWSLYEGLRHKSLVSRTAFMAMQFGDAELEKVVEKYFMPAVAKAGFELHRVTEGQGAGLIDNQIRAKIRAARFVVADLSHDNNGAYFEAGFAEGLSLPVLYTCEAKKFTEKKTHFDTNHMMTILWDAADPDSAARKLTATIRNTLPAEATMTPDE